jgi:hypothetical protein
LLGYTMPVDYTFISYLRVSTDKQGRSGLGLEAQRHAVATHVAGGRLLGEYLEVESGKRNDRPQLAAALAHAQATGSKLVIAKLDRLARNVRRSAASSSRAVRRPGQTFGALRRFEPLRDPDPIPGRPKPPGRRATQSLCIGPTSSTGCAADGMPRDAIMPATRRSSTLSGEATRG